LEVSRPLATGQINRVTPLDFNYQANKLASTKVKGKIEKLPPFMSNPGMSFKQQVVYPTILQAKNSYILTYKIRGGGPV
jgi:hypothetical protein